jgi:hypothetical protein
VTLNCTDRDDRSGQQWMSPGEKQRGLPEKPHRWSVYSARRVCETELCDAFPIRACLFLRAETAEGRQNAALILFCPLKDYVKTECYALKPGPVLRID